MELYHGSKSGIRGAIAPISREYCDFGKERDLLKKESEANRSQGIAVADEICKKYRREGRFFDEILTSGEIK